MIESVHVFLNHPVGWLFSEIIGRASLGGGMIKVDPIEYRNIKLIYINISNVDSILPDKEIKSVFSRMWDRPDWRNSNE